MSLPPMLSSVFMSVAISMRMLLMVTVSEFLTLDFTTSHRLYGSKQLVGLEVIRW